MAGAGFAVVGVFLILADHPIAAVVCLLLFIAVAICLIFFIRSAMSSYPNLMEETKRIGDPEQIGQALYALPQDPRAKGMLRFNDTLLFYMFTGNAHICLFSEITALKTEVRRDDSGNVVSFHAYILIETAAGTKIEITCKEEKDMNELMSVLSGFKQKNQAQR